jgi:hypothetical protein
LYELYAFSKYTVLEDECLRCPLRAVKNGLLVGNSIPGIHTFMHSFKCRPIPQCCVFPRETMPHRDPQLKFTGSGSNFPVLQTSLSDECA